MLRFQMQAMPCLFFKKLNGFSLFWRSNTYPFYSCIGRAFFRIMRISNGCFANLYCKFRILTFLKHNSGCLGFFLFSMGLNEVKMNCQNPSFVGKMFQTEKFMFFNREPSFIYWNYFWKKKGVGF